MASVHSNALYGYTAHTPLQAPNAAYGARFNAVFSPATSPSESAAAIAQIPAVNGKGSGVVYCK